RLRARRLPARGGYAGEPAPRGIRGGVRARLVPVDREQHLLSVLQRVHLRRLGRGDVRREPPDGAACAGAAGGPDLRHDHRGGSRAVPQQLEPPRRDRLRRRLAPDSRGIPVFPRLTVSRVPLAVAAFHVLLLTPSIGAAQRSTVNFDRGWRFHLGDVAGAQDPTFPDSGWPLLDVPHDWSIEGAFSDTNRAGPAGGALPGG